MNELWKNTVITKISAVAYVAPNAGMRIHKNRPYHGFVLNDDKEIKNYCFDDGRIMRTAENELFYLPKGSSYRVESICQGGCFAINFDADVSDEPFCLKLKNSESLKKNFKIACDEWLSQDSTCYAAAMRALYDGIHMVQKEQAQSYMPNDRHCLIAPAVELIERDFTDLNLTVATLAAMCGISEVYFRKIFVHSFGVSPKEYMIRKRMEYAKQLIPLGEIGISEIAELCGYSEPCHFSREFKKRFGVAPKNYI